jgi:bifunctional non-homologous end joining protein LigD
MSPAAADSITVEGRNIRITHVDRVLYPEDQVRKADVISYYVQVSARLLPHLHQRPVTRIRWPDGVEGESFYERNLPSHAPAWIKRVVLDHSDGPVTYPLIDSQATLAWLAQQNALELHVPQWRLHGSDRKVDRLVLDLDPGPGTGLAECAEVAVWLRDKLADDGLPSVPVTSGSKGIHLYSRWPPTDTATDSREYAKKLAAAAVSAMPKLVTATMAKQLRRDKLLIDWSQNNPAKTTVTPYSLRGRTHPWVAAPREWSEVEQPGLGQLTMTDVLAQLADSDPMTLLD